jgi:hypothetical protein
MAAMNPDIAARGIDVTMWDWKLRSNKAGAQINEVLQTAFRKKPPELTLDYFSLTEINLFVELNLAKHGVRRGPEWNIQLDVVIDEFISYVCSDRFSADYQKTKLESAAASMRALTEKLDNAASRVVMTPRTEGDIK